MVSFRHINGFPRGLHPLKRLQQVQEEIFRQMQLLVPDDYAFHEFRDGDDRSFAPDAHIRLYQDAHLAEATSYNTGQGCTRTAHPSYPPRQLLAQAWRRNRALDRWLDYLLKQGHSLATMKPAAEPLDSGSTESGRAKISELT